MKELVAQPKLVEQVRDAIVNEINEGRLVPGERIIQEQIAQELGVSRQPVQQALLLLRNEGVLRNAPAPGRGLIVAPLDLDYVQSVYEIRAVMEGLAFRKAAELNAERAGKSGPAIIQKGRKAVKSKSVAAMITADREFHDFIYELSQNPLIAPAMQSQWTSTQRVMGEVLMRDERPRDIWDQHEALLAAVTKGDGKTAEQLARQHVMQAANFMIARLRNQREPVAGDGTTADSDSAPSARASKGSTAKTGAAKGTAVKAGTPRAAQAR
jgi:DNA-binding GntR family transcriptional regulator